MYGGLGVKAQYMYTLLLSVRDIIVHGHEVDPNLWRHLDVDHDSGAVQNGHGSPKQKHERGSWWGAATTTWVNHQHDPGRTRFRVLQVAALQCTAFTPTYQLTTLAGRQAGWLAGPIQFVQDGGKQSAGTATPSSPITTGRRQPTGAGKGGPIRHGGATERRRRKGLKRAVSWQAESSCLPRR